MRVRSLHREDPLEAGTATHSSILATPIWVAIVKKQTKTENRSCEREMLDC